MRFLQVFSLVSSLLVAAGATPNAVAPSEDWKTSHKPVHFKGHLKVTATNGTFVGYVTSKLSRFGTYVVCTHKNQASTISFTAPKSGKSKDLLLKDETSKFPTVPFLGAVIQHGFSLGTGKKRAGSAASASSAGSKPTNPNEPPASLPNTANPSGNNEPPSRRDEVEDMKRSSFYQVESAIWSFDPEDHAITGSFINPDKKPVHVALHYNPGPHTPPGLDLVSDPSAYKHANPHSFGIKVEFVSA